MDEQLVNLIRDQFKSIHDKIDMAHEHTRTTISSVKETVDAHMEEDRKYWQAIDEQRAQVSLLKTLFGGASASGALAWFWSKFGH